MIHPSAARPRVSIDSEPVTHSQTTIPVGASGTLSRKSLQEIAKRVSQGWRIRSDMDVLIAFANEHLPK